LEQTVNFPFSTNDSGGNNGVAVGAAAGADVAAGAEVAAGAAGAAVGAEAQLLSISPRTTLHEIKTKLLFISSSPLA
jgi:hypothetical protein